MLEQAMEHGLETVEIWGDVRMDIEALSISEMTPEVSITVFYMVLVAVAGCNGACILANAHEACAWTLAPYPKSTGFPMEQH